MQHLVAFCDFANCNGKTKNAQQHCNVEKSQGRMHVKILPMPAESVQFTRHKIERGHIYLLALEFTFFLDFGFADF